VERAVAAGSVYQIRLGGTPSANALNSLATRGLGLRKAEGFGGVAGMPKPPPDVAKLKNEVIALRTLADKYRDAVVVDIQEAAKQLASGQSPKWGITGRLVNPPDGLRKDNPHDWKRWADACTTIMTIDDRDVLLTLATHIRSNR